MHISQRNNFLQYIAQTNPFPLLFEIEKADGIFLYDTTGKKYIDLISGIAVANMGHNFTPIVDAIKNQAEKYLHTMVYGEMVQQPQVEFAQQICKQLPLNLNNVYFTNSGSEATELAMKIAKKFTKKTGFIAHTNAYHGSTQGAMSLNSSEYYTNKFRPLHPNVFFVNQNKFDELQQINPNNIAAFFLELIQAEKGMEVCDKKYVKEVKNWCDKNNILLIIDEIQTGFGRTGMPFCLEYFEIEPDLLLLGKALGGGLPLGAVIGDKKIMQCISNAPILGHTTTFGGNPVSCAAGKTMFENILTVSTEIEKKEKFIREKLNKEKINAIHGKGLLLAIEPKYKTDCIALCAELLDQGIFTDWFLFNTNRFRFAPPLNISMEEMEMVCNIINSVL